MKLAIVKQKYVPGYTWKSHRWDNPKSMLDDFIFRSKNFGLLFETKGDVWVIDDTKYKPRIYRAMLEKRPQEIKQLYRAQQSVSASTVPWNEYDVVIALDPVIHKRIIKKYPKVLWCYYASEHSSKEYGESLGKPYPPYDLFLDHMLDKKVHTSSGLPTTLHFPAIVSRMAMQKTIDLTQKRDAVFVDSHGIRNISLTVFKVQTESLFGIEVDFPTPWNFKKSFGAVAQRNPLSTKDFLQRLANCKYFWLKRKSHGDGFAGQAGPEAASVGCVVLADESCKYAQRMCHPAAIMKDGSNAQAAARIIKRIQGDDNLYQEILVHQRQRIDTFFNEAPRAQLEKYLNIKRRTAGIV